MQVVDVGLGTSQIARRETVRLRLASRGGSNRSVSGDHIDEFALAFGFLEESSGNYFAGKFGLVGQYVAARARGRGYFDQNRAQAALLFYSALERHADCIFPLIVAISQDIEAPRALFAELIRRNVEFKKSRWMEADLPKNQAYQVGAEKYREYATEWAEVDSADPHNQSRPRGPKRLVEKTRDGYYQRTVRYMSDLGFVSIGSDRKPRLSGRATEMVMMAEAQGVSFSRDVAELPPSMEAIHDAFSINEERYLQIFQPMVDQGLFERLVGTFAMPNTQLVAWEEVPGIAEEFPVIVDSLSENLTGSARLDAVRLAMFIYSIGAGRPTVLDSGAGSLGQSAAVELGLANPRKFMLGHARSGQRFWSVTLLRR